MPMIPGAFPSNDMRLPDDEGVASAQMIPVDPEEEALDPSVMGEGMPEPAELAQMLGMMIGEARMQAHQQIDVEAQQTTQALTQIIMEAAQMGAPGVEAPGLPPVIG